MTAEQKILEFVQRLAKAHVYDSRDTGRVIVAEWKEEAQQILEEEGMA